MGKLVPCKTCKKKIDNTARSCPHCGVKSPGSTKPGCFPIIFVSFVAIIIIISTMDVPDRENTSPINTASSDSVATPPILKSPLEPLAALPKPFKDPIKYLGLSIIDASDLSGVRFEQVDAGEHRINYESEDGKLYIRSNSGFVTWVDIDLKKTQSCSQKIPFDPNPFLQALDINPVNLSPASDRTHMHTFYDHFRRLKISVVCQYDGAVMNVSIGSKYYLQ
jgi:hypothetical protein